MVEETTSKAKSKGETRPKPKPVYLWTVVDVVKWLKRHCGVECHAKYADNFVQHEITGRALIRVNDSTLIRIGVENTAVRQEILRQIMKCRLRTNWMEIMDLNRQDTLSCYYE